jgi:hypothetical protein
MDQARRYEGTGVRDSVSMGDESVGRWRGISVGGRGRVAGLPRNERATSPGATGYVSPSPYGAPETKKRTPAKRSAKGTTKAERTARDRRIRAEAEVAREAFKAKRLRQATNLTREGLQDLVRRDGPAVLVSVPAGLLLALLDERDACRLMGETAEE